MGLVSGRVDEIDVQVDKVRALVQRAASFGDVELAAGGAMSMEMGVIQKSIDKACAALEALDAHFRDVMRKKNT